MTNDDMWALIWNRTRGFYERIVLPYAMYDEGDIERAEEYLLFQFSKSPSPWAWMASFFKGIEETETTVSLHVRKLESFRLEISNVLKYVASVSIVDAFNVTTYPPFSTNKSKAL